MDKTQTLARINAITSAMTNPMRRMVLCTSSSGLDYLEKPDNIRILRHHIDIYGDDYLDGDSINANKIAQLMMDDKNLLPDTSPPTVDEILAELTYLESEGCEEVFIICISSAFSDTYEHLHQAKELFDKDMFIHILDSRTLSYSEAMLALEASNMLYDNKPAIEISQRLQTLRDNNSLWFVINDIRNLVKTRRISLPAGLVANLLDIKPVLTIDETGNIVPKEKVRKLSKAIDYLCQFALETLAERPGKIYLINTGSTDLINSVAFQLKKSGLEDVPIYPTASTAIANHGPYGVGIGIIHDC